MDLEAKPAVAGADVAAFSRCVPPRSAASNLKCARCSAFSAGTLDPTLNTVGYSTADSGHDDQGFAAAYNPITHDTIVVGQSNQQFGLAAYMANGQLDPTFGSGGVLTIIPTDATSNPAGTSAIDAVAIDSSGKIVVGGWGTFGTGGQNFVVARFDAQGHIDTSFGTSGFVSTDISGRVDQINALTFDSTGKILVAGQTVSGSAVHAAFRGTRLPVYWIQPSGPQALPPQRR